MPLVDTTPMLTDSHCHLDHRDLVGEVDAVVARAAAAGVTRLITISTHVARAATYQALSARFANVFHSIGTHPHHAAEEPDVTLEMLVALSRDPRCVAIGEAGLDYFYDRSPREVQERVFRTHIAAARETGLPLVVHARDADADMIRIFDEEMGKGAFSAILHCFSSGRELAQAGIRYGFALSFSGILTFRRSEELRAIAADVPLDQLLVETDAPYLAPEPHRGKRNEPAFTPLTAAVLADVKGLTLDALATATERNCRRIFGKLDGGDQAAS
jgi:TatD DNase family protein